MIYTCICFKQNIFPKCLDIWEKVGGNFRHFGTFLQFLGLFKELELNYIDFCALQRKVFLKIYLKIPNIAEIWSF